MIPSELGTRFIQRLGVGEQRTNAQVNLGYLIALREFWIAEVEMEGFLLTGSLESP